MIKQQLSFETMRKANIERDKFWDTESKIDASYRGNEFAGEAGEVCNVIKKLERERLGIRGSRDTVAHLAEEIADAMICLELIAMHYGIDLASAYACKFNATSAKQKLPIFIGAGDVVVNQHTHPPMGMDHVPCDQCSSWDFSCTGACKNEA